MNQDKSRQRLGRGLASLIGGGPTERAGKAQPDTGAASTAATSIAIEAIRPNPRNPRRSFGEAELSDLAASIRVHGVVQPLLVRPVPDEAERFEIVAGERRWRAARMAGLADVPALVRQMGDREALEIAIIENVQRADLNPIEEAQGYETLIDEHGYTQSDLADALGKSRSHVANTLRLLKLPDAVRDMVAAGELSPGHARTAVSAEDPEAFARAILDGGLSVREAEARARGPVDESKPAVRGPRASKPKRPSRDADTQALERLLGEALGMIVEIRLSRDGGDIRIEYASLEQLDEICGLLQAGQRARNQSEPRIHSL